MSEYDWHPVVPLRWSVTGNLQQQFKRRVSNSRGVWYDEYEWRDVPIEQPAQETPDAPETLVAEELRRDRERLCAPETRVPNYDLGPITHDCTGADCKDLSHAEPVT